MPGFIQIYDQHDTMLTTYLCLVCFRGGQGKLKVRERSESDNGFTAAHALEAAPVDDSIVHNTTILLHE